MAFDLSLDLDRDLARALIHSLIRPPTDVIASGAVTHLGVAVTEDAEAVTYNP